tara:strand:- start:1421 stop:3487 length:2067 start_codon:yes stop_codon:yes gene_type:complete
MIGNKYKYLVFLLFIFIIFLHHFFGYLGHYGWDDMHYALLAQNFLEGTLPFDDHYSYRWPTIILTAISYKLFGVNDFSSALPSILVSVGILSIVFYLLKKKSSWVLFIGLSILTLSNWFIFYTDKIMPDIYVAFFVLCSVYIYYHYKYLSLEKKPWQSAILFSFCLFLGFLSKETILLFVPVLIYLFILDVFIYKRKTFWIYTIISGVAILLLYFLILYFITGDAFIRFTAILNNRYVSECSYNLMPVSVVIKRVLYEFFKMFIYHGMILPFVLVVAFICQKGFKKIWLLKDELSFFSIVGILLIISSNFMSISPTEYIPMCIDPRHYLFIFPILSIASALIIEKFIENNINKKIVFGGLLLITILAFFINKDTFWVHYLPLIILFLIYSIFSFQQKWTKQLFAVLFFIILIVIPIQNGIAYRKSGYNAQKTAVIENIIKKQKDCVIISNEVQTRFGKYYNEFNTENNLNFVSFNDVTDDILSSPFKKILVFSPYTTMLSNQNIENLPFYVTIIDSASSPLIYNDETYGVRIYELNKIAVKLITSTNDFEESKPNWNDSKSNLTTDFSRSKINAFKVEEYSSTFKLNLDEVNLSSNLIISGEVYHLFKDSTEASIVVSIENNEGVYFWENAGLNYFTKNDNDWKQVEFNYSLSQKEIKPNSILKVYVWNPEKQECIIDDFKVELIGFK